MTECNILADGLRFPQGPGVAAMPDGLRFPQGPGVAAMPDGLRFPQGPGVAAMPDGLRFPQGPGPAAMPDGSIILLEIARGAPSVFAAIYDRSRFFMYGSG